jgi:TonB family protein
MSEVWKECEGQVVDNLFPLQQYLGGTEGSAVFLTQTATPHPQKAAIKLISVDRAAADLQLSLWRRASQLSHAHLLCLFSSGRCRLANRDLLYVVMEHAEEDLSQILPQRPLTASETREMLEPVLDVLVYLHGKGFVHAHIKPSNILATSDQLKLSSDTLFPIGESPKALRKPDPYDAPEAGSSPLSPYSDVWSLGMTLVEALTQQPPTLPLDTQANPIFPDTLPQPFLDIACHALRRDPKRRWSMAEIAARLNPAAAAAVAAQATAVSPLAVPLSPVPAVPAAKLQAPKFDAPMPMAPPSRPQTITPRPKQTLVLPNYVVPVLAAVFVVVTILALPKLLSRRAEPSPSASAGPAQPAAQPKSQPKHALRQTPPLSKASSQTSLASAPMTKTASGKNTAEDALGSAAASKPTAVTAPAPASLRTDTFPSANAPNSSGASSARGEVLEQVLPDVSEEARATIQGTVRVGVRVQVDPVGNVSEAVLDSPGPSQYFADLALKGAHRWQFTSPEINGHSVPSEWLIRFEFSQSGTKAFPKQTAP